MGGINNMSQTDIVVVSIYSPPSDRYAYVVYADYRFRFRKRDMLQCLPSNQCWILDKRCNRHFRNILWLVFAPAGPNGALQRPPEKHCISEITMCWYWPAVLHGSFLWWTRLCKEDAPRKHCLCVSCVTWGRAVIGRSGNVCLWPYLQQQWSHDPSHWSLNVILFPLSTVRYHKTLSHCCLIGRLRFSVENMRAGVIWCFPMKTTDAMSLLWREIRSLWMRGSIVHVWYARCLTPLCREIPSRGMRSNIDHIWYTRRRIAHGTNGPHGTCAARKSLILVYTHKLSDL